MSRKSASSRELESLIKKVQREVKAARRTHELPLAEQLQADLRRYLHTAPRRRHAGVIWLQLSAPSLKNPAVGLYMHPDLSQVLRLDDQGRPHIQTVDAVVRTGGEVMLRRASSRAAQTPIERTGLQGEDLLTAFRRYQAHPILLDPEPTKNPRPARARRQRRRMPRKPGRRKES